jgi:hypothetical protein
MTDGNKFTCCQGNILVETKIINMPVEKRFSCFLFVGKNQRTLEICNRKGYEAYLRNKYRIFFKSIITNMLILRIL